MIIDIIIMAIIVISAFFLGFFIGIILRPTTYDGVITMIETDRGLIYSLELASDPELLANQKEVKFKVRAPSYDELLSR
jgi:hypothetical protein